ncbi:MAG: type VI secretion system baseplate subunit TssK, partial [Deltaproteobacteria bacterium]|nr:type VI secretion system baseplate subunit TssK [Deltaproteobacteria bacterium]
EVRGVLPGGTILDLQEGDPGLPASRDIANHFGATVAVVDVFLAVVAAREGAQNYMLPEDEEHGVRMTRFGCSTREVIDLVSAQSEAPVTFARPRATILFGDENRQDYDTIKIAELRRSETGAFELSRDYVPPCMRLSAAPAVLSWLRDVLGLMVTKRRALVRSLSQVDLARVEFTAQDVTRYLQMSAINGHIPLLRNFSESTELDPYSLYRELSALAGSLATFSSEVAPEELPVFEYLDLRKTFQDLCQKIRMLLDLALQEHVISVPLEARPDGMWIGVLKDPRLLDCSTFELSVETNATEQEVANRLPQLSKVASWKQIPKIVRSAIPGAPLVAAHRPPAQVPVRARSVYFLVETAHDYWREIVEEKTIAIYLPPPFDPSRATIELLAVPEQPRRAR